MNEEEFKELREKAQQKIDRESMIYKTNIFLSKLFKTKEKVQGKFDMIRQQAYESLAFKLNTEKAAGYLIASAIAFTSYSVGKEHGRTYSQNNLKRYSQEDKIDNIQKNNLRLEQKVTEKAVKNIKNIKKGKEYHISEKDHISEDDNIKDIPSAPDGYEYWKTIDAKVTAYEPSEVSCGDYADGLTSLGDNAYVFDGVAADPKAIPYRTKVFISGKGFKEVDDTGIAMRRSWKKGKYHIDLRLSNVTDALNFGVQNKKIHLYRKK